MGVKRRHYYTACDNGRSTYVKNSSAGYGSALDRYNSRGCVNVYQAAFFMAPCNILRKRINPGLLQCLLNYGIRQQFRYCRGVHTPPVSLIGLIRP